MNELPHELLVRRPPARTGAARRARVRRSRLAETLSEARADKGLELRELSVITGVRMSHLEALEAGDYGRLPEDAKGKTAVRLYARAVGLDPARMLLLYTQERRGVYAPPPELELPQDNTRTPRPVWGRLGRWLATLALITATLGGSLWAFNTVLFPPVGTPTSTSEPAATRATSQPLQNLSQSPPPSTPVDLSTADVPVRPPPTLPPTVGVRPVEVPPAEVPLEATLDSAAPDAPSVSPPNTEVAASTPADTQTEASAPLERSPAQPAAASSVTSSEAVPEQDATASASPASPTGLTLTVTAPAWLEVYTGGARREGERLVYRLAEPGETLTFELPVFIFTGNAGGLTVSVAGGPAEPLGRPNVVVGRAFAEQE